MAWKQRRYGLAEGRAATEAPPFQVGGKVGRIENPPAGAFLRRYVERNRPVVVTGAMTGWRARTQWNDAYLRERIGDRAGEVIVSVNGLFPDYLTKPEPMTKAQIPFSEFLERAQGRASRRDPIMAEHETYYIYGKPYLFEQVPGLCDDVPKPECLEGIEPGLPNLWISSTGCTTPLHYDLINGLLGQIRGSKQVYLFAPDQIDCLYQRGKHFPGLDNNERQSQVDIHHPDFDAFPRFREARALEATLQPGDMLFIPSNWFHEVETLEFSISVGFTFAGGTATSKFAAMADAFKGMGGPGSNPMDPAQLAAMERQLRENPDLLMKLMKSPLFQQMLQNPAMMDQLRKNQSGS